MFEDLFLFSFDLAFQCPQKWFLPFFKLNLNHLPHYLVMLWVLGNPSPDRSFPYRFFFKISDCWLLSLEELDRFSLLLLLIFLEIPSVFCRLMLKLVNGMVSLVSSEELSNSFLMLTYSSSLPRWCEVYFKSNSWTMDRSVLYVLSWTLLPSLLSDQPTSDGSLFVALLLFFW